MFSLEDIEQPFIDFKNHIVHLAQKKWDQYSPFLNGIWKILLADGKGILRAAATAAVAAAESQGGSGADKMHAALDIFKTTVETQGLVFIEKEARWLLETALQNLAA